MLERVTDVPVLFIGTHFAAPTGGIHSRQGRFTPPGVNRCGVRALIGAVSACSHGKHKGHTISAYAAGAKQSSRPTAATTEVPTYAPDAPAET